MVTITGGNTEPLKGEETQCYDKPTVFISSRVHCGETVASYFLLGMYNFLVSGCEQSTLLLEKFVFKIVPCLNPDGCIRGYWRVDCNGVNMNRVYTDPDPVLFPTIHATKKAIEAEHERGKLFAYTDLHGHATKRGCFVFGNSSADSESHIQQMLFPKLMSLNCVNFDFSECSFSDEANNKKDLKGDSREGSGRAAIYKMTNCP